MIFCRFGMQFFYIGYGRHPPATVRSGARGAHQGAAPCQARLAPDIAAAVVLAEGTRSSRHHDPWLLRLGIDVYVRRKSIGLIERADAHEADPLARAEVMAP